MKSINLLILAGSLFLAPLAMATEFNEEVHELPAPITGDAAGLENIPIAILRFNTQGGTRELQSIKVEHHLVYEFRACAENLTNSTNGVTYVQHTPFVEFKAVGRRVARSYFTLSSAFENLAPFDGAADFVGPSSWCTRRHNMMYPAEFETVVDDNGDPVDLNLVERYAAKLYGKRWSPVFQFDPNNPADMFVNLTLSAGVERTDALDLSAIGINMELDEPVVLARIKITYYWLPVGP